MKTNWKLLAVNLVIPLCVGGLSAFLTRGSMELYKNLKQPPLAPPGWVFPVVWTILFILMGISTYLICHSHSKDKKSALRIYALQLALNFTWSLVFFNMGNFLLAFLVLVALWVAILAMIRSFRTIDTTAARLQIPYLLWVTFAGYLNAAIYLLNR